MVTLLRHTWSDYLLYHGSHRWDTAGVWTLLNQSCMQQILQTSQSCFSYICIEQRDMREAIVFINSSQWPLFVEDVLFPFLLEGRFVQRIKSIGNLTKELIGLYQRVSYVMCGFRLKTNSLQAPGIRMLFSVHYLSINIELRPLTPPLDPHPKI